MSTAFRGRHASERFPHGVRLILFLAGAFFLAIGLIGLALPAIPQMVPLVLGLGLLSLASRTIDDWIHRRLERWPRADAAVHEVQHKLERLFRRRARRPEGED